MDVAEFWAVMAEAATADELHRRLDGLSDAELADFEVHHMTAYRRSYDWGLWGAAYLIHDGCSNDSFDYFRAYLISLGREIFEAALADPDSLADVEFGRAGDWESWESPTFVAMDARTGEMGYFAQERHPPIPVEPSGQAWRDEELPGRFRRLAAKYDW
jgi:hypothetical protein